MTWFNHICFKIYFEKRTQYKHILIIDLHFKRFLLQFLQINVLFSSRYFNGKTTT